MKKVTRNIARILIFTLIVSSFGIGFDLLKDRNSMNETVYSSNYAESRDQYAFVDRKIQDELENNTGLLNEKIEKRLNELGVEDGDILGYSEDTIELLNQINVDDIVVQSQYYSVEDSEELKDVLITENEMKVLSDSDVNKLFAKEFYGQVDSDKHSVIDDALEFLGVSAQKVDAATTKAAGGINDSKHKTYLRKTVTTIDRNINKKRSVYAMITFKWTKMPLYRELDTMHIDWVGATFDTKLRDKSYVTHTWTQRLYGYPDTKGNVKYQDITGSVKMTPIGESDTNLMSDQYRYTNNDIKIAAKLHDNYQTRGLSRDYLNESITACVYLLRTPGNKEVIIRPTYLHAKTNYHLKSLAVDCISKSAVKAVYKLVSGGYKTIKYEHSGPALESDFFTFKF